MDPIRSEPDLVSLQTNKTLADLKMFKLFLEFRWNQICLFSAQASATSASQR